MRHITPVALALAAASLSSLAWSQAAISDAQIQEAVAGGKSAGTHNLKDPAAAQFRGLKIARVSKESSDLVLCGEINARNSVGGYVGFRSFFATPGRPDLSDIEPTREMDKNMFATMYKMSCALEVKSVE